MKTKPTILKLVGKKVKTVRGFLYKIDKRIKNPSCEPVYILFDDKKTFIELEEQDYYSYHDCNSYARELNIKQDKIRWDIIFKDKKHYPVVTRDIWQY